MTLQTALPNASVLPAVLQFSWPTQISAEIMQQYAREFCRGSYLDANGCRWYHGNWKHLKMLDLVSNPYWHSHFYLKYLGHALSEFAFPHILISGTADDGLLSLIAAPILTLADPRRVAITVIDACRTPLRVCQDFADKYGLNVTIQQADAQSMPFGDESFDVIMTDAFLTRFPPDGKTAVVREWSRILHKNGVILTTTRVEAGKPDAFFTKPSIPGFRDRAKYAWRTAQTSSRLGLKPLMMVRRALGYSGRMASYPFRSTSAVEEIFRSSGFEVKLEHGAKGLREAEPRDYALVYARKSSRPLSMAPVERPNVKSEVSAE